MIADDFNKEPKEPEGLTEVSDGDRTIYVPAKRWSNFIPGNHQGPVTVGSGGGGSPGSSGGNGGGVTVRRSLPPVGVQACRRLEGARDTLLKLHNEGFKEGRISFDEATAIQLILENMK